MIPFIVSNSTALSLMSQNYLQISCNDIVDVGNSHGLTLIDRLCGLVVRVPGYRMEMYCVSCEVRTEFIYVMLKKVDRLCGLVVRVPGYRMEMYCFL
jgi:hypothetical protein